jgi:hypothetical protein
LRAISWRRVKRFVASFAIRRGLKTGGGKGAKLQSLSRRNLTDECRQANSERLVLLPNINRKHYHDSLS